MQSRLEQLMHRRVIYTVTDQDGIYTGTVERDSNGRAYVQDTHGTGGTYRVRNLWIQIRGQPTPEVSGRKIKAPTYIYE